MNHGLKLHPDGTLEITMPKGKKVGRVLVCEAGTQNGKLFYEKPTYEQVMTYCEERCMSLITNDMLYQLTRGQNG